MIYTVISAGETENSRKNRRRIKEMNKLFSKKDIICTIYREGSFSKASKALFISQPALSAIVKQAEEDIGVPLIDRSCKPIMMTEAGMEYIRAAEQITAIEESFTNYVQAVNNISTGTLKVGCNQLFSVLVIPRYISAFIEAYPKVEVKLTNASSPELQEKLTGGTLDLVIDSKVFPEDSFEGRLFYKEHLLLAVPAAFSVNEELKACALTRKDILSGRHLDDDVAAVNLSALKDTPFLRLTKDNDTRQRTDRIFQEAGFTPKVILEVDRLITMHEYVHLGTAAGIVTDTLVRYSESSGKDVCFYKLTGDMVSRDVFVYCKRNKYRLPAVDGFIDLLCRGR